MRTAESTRADLVLEGQIAVEDQDRARPGLCLEPVLVNVLHDGLQHLILERSEYERRILQNNRRSAPL
jgi:hypothetical protein